MSQPTWTSLDAPSRSKTAGGPPDSNGAILDIGRGNWQQGTGNGDPLSRPKWMATVDIDGRRVWGVVPQIPFAVGENVVLPGEQSWDVRLFLDLATLGFADGKKHDLVTRIYAASFWPGGWGDNAQQPAGWEWGHFSAKDLAPAVFVQSFIVPAAVPDPQPEQPSLVWFRDQALKVLDEAVRVHGEATVSQTTRVRHMLRVGRTNETKRKLVDPALDKIGV